MSGTTTSSSATPMGVVRKSSGDVEAKHVFHDYASDVRPSARSSTCCITSTRLASSSLP